VSGDLWYHGRFTVTAAFFGYLIGASAGVLVAWPLGLVRLAYRIVEPYFLVAYSVPAVAMGPVFILWFGIGMTPKVLIAAYFVFFIVFINTVAGFQQVPQGLLDVTRVMGASRRDQLRRVMLPSALPFILAALRITLPAAMIGAVTGEFISANRGLGFLTREAGSRFNTAGVLAGVLCLSVIVLLMNLMLRPLRHALRWQQDTPITRETP
jgi:NitT/TauT family transport system permease protein